MKPSSFLIPLAMLAAPVAAHWPWIEPARENGPARAYFGVFPNEKMTGTRVQAMAGARFWSYTGSAGFEVAKPSVEANALHLGAADGVVMDYEFGIDAGHGPATLLFYSAKAFRSQIPASSPAPLALEIVAAAEVKLERGQLAKLRLLRNGRPLAGQTIHLYNDLQGERHMAMLKARKESKKHDHAQSTAAGRSEEPGEIPADALRFTSGSDGAFDLTLPAAGRYQFHVSVREATPGSRDGRTYASVTLMSTLCVDIR